MFLIFTILSLIIALAAGIYIYLCVRRLMEFYGADIKKKWVKAANIIITVILAGLCVFLFTNAAVVILHLVASFLFFDIIAYIFQKIYGKRQKGSKYFACRKIYQCGILPVVMACIILGYGYYNMNHIRAKTYEITTDKYTGNCRILFLSDVHYDTVQDTDVLKDAIYYMDIWHPDIVILGGDIVEEGTSKEKMQEVFNLLGGLENKYGIYYVYGNHDRQPYTNHRTFSDKELEQAIIQSGIYILEDTYVETSNGIVLAGRADATMGGDSNRKSSKKILQDADHSKYIIVADHQPIGVEENDAQGADLELSGHTHGGQIWPAGPLSEIAGVLNYGLYKKGNCKLIVSSGVAGWTYSMRTGKHCEYVIVDIKGK